MHEPSELLYTRLIATLEADVGKHAGVERQAGSWRALRTVASGVAVRLPCRARPSRDKGRWRWQTTPAVDVARQRPARSRRERRGLLGAAREQPAPRRDVRCKIAGHILRAGVQLEGEQLARGQEGNVELGCGRATAQSVDVCDGAWAQSPSTRASGLRSAERDLDLTSRAGVSGLRWGPARGRARQPESSRDPSSVWCRRSGRGPLRRSLTDLAAESRNRRRRRPMRFLVRPSWGEAGWEEGQTPGAGPL
jgi:hypothetical protein